MLKWLMRKGIAAFERKWDYDASYVHELIEADPVAVWKFSRAAAIGSYAMGHGKTCSRVVVAGTPMTFDHAIREAHRA